MSISKSEVEALKLEAQAAAYRAQIERANRAAPPVASAPAEAPAAAPVNVHAEVTRLASTGHGLAARMAILADPAAYIAASEAARAAAAPAAPAAPAPPPAAPAPATPPPPAPSAPAPAAPPPAAQPNLREQLAAITDPLARRAFILAHHREWAALGDEDYAARGWGRR